MTIVSSYNWNSDSWTHHNGENPARKAFREAVEVVAVHAREKLPEAVNGRIEAAVKIVIQGDVELLPDDKAKIGSQSNGVTKYHLVDGTCDCRDFEKAPDNWCKHRIAFGIYKRATALAKERLAQLDAATNATTTPAPDQVTTEVLVPVPTQEPVAAPATPALPEAPASVNCFVTLAGRQVQVTLRDQDEQRLLTRLATLLQQFPIVEEPKEHAQKDGWCSKHNVPMKLNHGKKGSWWSHKTGIHLNRDKLSSIAYSDQLNSITISATLTSADRRHDIVG